MAIHHSVADVRIENGSLYMIVDGKSMQRSLSDVSRRLAVASEAETALFEVSPSGYGIHWPLLDEDISIDGLLGITHMPVEWKKSA